MTNRTLPSQSTDPTPKPRERDVDGMLRAAANLAPVVIPGEVGEQVKQLLWAYYNTPQASSMGYPLAKAILETAADVPARAPRSS